MIDSIIDLVPDSAKAAAAELDRFIAERDAAMQRTFVSGDIAARMQAFAEVKALEAQIEQQQKIVSKETSNTFRAVLPRLQSDNPQQVTVTFDSSIPANRHAEIKQLIELTAGMAAQRADGSPIVVNVSAGRASQYVINTQTIELRLDRAAGSTLVHETVHAMQHQLGYGVKETDAYGDAATKGVTAIPQSAKAIKHIQALQILIMHIAYILILLDKVWANGARSLPPALIECRCIARKRIAVYSSWLCRLLRITANDYTRYYQG
jgi:hypothetical protein